MLPFGSEGGPTRGKGSCIYLAFDTMIQAKGVKKAFSELLSEEAWDSCVEAMRVPDWINLLFKLRSRLSDSAWVDLTSLTKLGRSGVSYLFIFLVLLFYCDLLHLLFFCVNPNLLVFVVGLNY